MNTFLFDFAILGALLFTRIFYPSKTNEPFFTIGLLLLLASVARRHLQSNIPSPQSVAVAPPPPVEEEQQPTKNTTYDFYASELGTGERQHQPFLMNRPFRLC